MMQLFKKKCRLCKLKIDKGKEVWEVVKLPEFSVLKNQPFCSEDHAEMFKRCVIGTPAKSSCMNCKE